ncbi:VQ motif-containing protein 4-like isoform X2 [Diospyros lotus]|uniref:VQ motif-containing protein 4-like isoform X2 n=1 Tax=Diospyros lotus TaxID=55363 RepID=UPI00224D2116|nr:VQ motif-containing protein 4-like isoform X2 [Diospyros lotus]
MENKPNNLEEESPYPKTSPESSNTSNCVENPSTPKAISISEAHGFPTTSFIQADTNSFKQIVQMLTGSPETNKQPSKPAASPVKTGPKKHGFKLQERRNSLKNLKIIPGLALNSLLSPSHPSTLSPSVLGLHELVLSPITPPNSETIDRPSPSGCLSSLEEKGMAENGFYLHATPVTAKRGISPA